MGISKTSSKHKSNLSELTFQLYFLLKVQMIKMKITHHWVIGDGCIHLWILAELFSHSVFYQVLNAVSDGMLKRKCLS